MLSEPSTIQYNLNWSGQFRHFDEDHANILNSLWLIAITFLSVGFGDIGNLSFFWKQSNHILLAIQKTRFLRALFGGQTSSIHKIYWKLHIFWMHFIVPNTYCGRAITLYTGIMVSSMSCFPFSFHFYYSHSTVSFSTHDEFE